MYQVEGGILITESCTEGEAIVAAETDEFYAMAPDTKPGLPRRYSHQRQLFSRASNPEEAADDLRNTQKERSEVAEETSSGDQMLPVDTIENEDVLIHEASDIFAKGTEPLETMPSGTENEDLILENV